MFPIASEYFERHELYLAAGIIDLWICGTSKYIGKNFRHKTLEDYNEGYYDSLNNLYFPGFNTEQGKFIEQLKRVKHCSINSYVLCEDSITHRSYVGKSYSALLKIHNMRTMYKNESKREYDDKISEFNNKFVGYGIRIRYSESKNKYYLVANNKFTNCSRVLNFNHGFYQSLNKYVRDFTFIKKLSHILFLLKNQNWRFAATIENDIVKIKVIIGFCYSEWFSETAEFQKSDIDVKNIESIKQALTPVMNSCYRKALIGNGKLRVMEVCN